VHPSTRAGRTSAPPTHLTKRPQPQHPYCAKQNINGRPNQEFRSTGSHQHRENASTGTPSVDRFPPTVLIRSNQRPRSVDRIPPGTSTLTSTTDPVEQPSTLGRPNQSRAFPHAQQQVRSTETTFGRTETHPHLSHGRTRL